MTFCDRAPALEHRLVDHAQVVLEQDEVGRLLGDVGGAVDRDADVGGVERRGVVDPVAEEADDGRPLEASSTRSFCCGVTRQNRLTCGETGAQRLVAQRRQLVPGEHAGDRQAELGADVPGHPLVVAGQDLHRDAARGQRRGSPPGAGLGRVEEGHEAGEDQFALVGHGGGGVIGPDIALEAIARTRKPSSPNCSKRPWSSARAAGIERLRRARLGLVLASTAAARPPARP